MTLTQAIIIFFILLVANLLYSQFISSQPKNNSPDYAINEAKNADTSSLTPAIKYFGTAIFILPLLGGLWGINHWLKDYNLAKDTASWKQSEGVIVSKSINSKVISNHSTQVTSSDLTYFMPEVVYQFKIGGDKYEGTNIDYHSHPAYGDEDKVKQFLDSLPGVGESITVYINNDNTKTVIKPGTQNMSYFGILVSIPFFIVGLIGIKFLYKF